MKYSIPYFPGLVKFWESRPELADVVEEIYFDLGQAAFSSEFIKIEDKIWSELIKMKQDNGIQLHQVHSRSVQHARNLLPNSIQAIVNRLNEASKRGVDRVTLGNPLLLNHMPVRRALAGVKLSTGLLDEIRTLSQVQSWVERFDVDVLLVHPDSNRNGSELIKIKKFASSHGVQVCLLVNEGCLPRCPFRKQEYDMLETLGKLPDKLRGQVFQTFFANTCGVIYRKRPESLLQSPFILPAAFDSLTDKADLLRISGLDSPPNVLEKLLTSLLDGTTDGLLLYGEYLSRLSPLQGPDILLSDFFGSDYLSKLEDCKSHCADCDVCGDRFKAIIHKHRLVMNK